VSSLDTKRIENLEEDKEKYEIPRKIFFLTSTERSIINRILQVNKAFSRSNSDESPPEISIYNPSKSSVVQTPSIQRLLMKRNYYIEKLREADTVGILVGTLSVDNYIEVIRHLKSILKQAGKKSYVVSIGEISAPKLANFPDINAFVLVACPETTLIESKEFYQVVVTPWEVEVAFGRQNEHADYFVDYRVLLPGSEEHIPFEKYSSRNIYADVSLINGVSRIGLNWQGLEELAPEAFKIHEGQSGIASYYSNEPQLS
jgi:diphthamide biosynthesis protein 2